MARDSPLKRRLAPPRPVRGVGDGAVEKLLRVEIPRAADQMLALQADVQAVTLSTLDNRGVVASLGAHDLICMITRASEDVGLLVVDIGLLTGLIEIQTLGQVTSVPAKERTPTRTDAVVVSDMPDRWMSDVCRAADETGLARDVPFHGYIREHGILGRRAVELTLDPGQYRSMRIAMVLGGEAKTGAVTFFVPVREGRAQVSGEDTLGARLRPHLMGAPAAMEAVLARINQPLERVLAFAVGDVLPIAPQALSEVQLEVNEDVPIARARLGQVNGFRAVRLTPDGGPVAGVDARAAFLAAKQAGTTAQSALSHAPDLGLPDPPATPAALEVEHSEMDDLPELPELNDFPDLPDLPDLPSP